MKLLKRQKNLSTNPRNTGGRKTVSLKRRKPPKRRNGPRRRPNGTLSLMKRKLPRRRRTPLKRKSFSRKSLRLLTSSNQCGTKERRERAESLRMVRRTSNLSQ